MVAAMEDSTARCWGNLAHGLGGATVGENIRIILVGTIGWLRLDNNIGDPLEPHISKQSRVELVDLFSLWCSSSQRLKDAPKLEGIL
jgi:hypothetical protein